MMRATILALALVTSQVTPAHTQTLQGPAKVLDGDTIDVGPYGSSVAGQRIRFAHIDALELDQYCQGNWPGGREATSFLKSMIGDQPVSCTNEGTDRYKRRLSVCTNHRGENLNELMVRYGYAVAYKGSPSNYYFEHWKAFRSEVGMWSLTKNCTLPAEWRAKIREIH